MTRAKTIKILIVTSYGFNDRMRNFIEFIVGRVLAKNSWKVSALAKSDTNKNEFCVSDGIKIYQIANKPTALFRILKILLFNRPDIIHIFNQRNNPSGILTALLNKIFRVPQIFTEYGLLHDHYLVTDRNNPFPLVEKLKPNGPILSFRKIFRDKNLRINFKNYLYHLPLSSANKIVFVSKHNLDIAKQMGLKNIHYLPYIFDEKRWISKTLTPTRQGVAKMKELENQKDTNFILFIGQMKLRKGWDIILEAMPHIENNLNVKLIFITPSSDKELLEFSQKTNKLKIKNKVIFLGKIENEILKKIYQICKLVVLPSRYEGFGLATTEAWEMEKPIVASDVIAINEHVINEYNGLMVQSESPLALSGGIERVLKNKNLYNNLIQGGKQTLNKLKSKEIQNKWLEFYKTTISKY